MSDFKNKVVLITGAGRSLGFALAKAFAEQGAWVAVNDLTPVNLDGLVDEINQSGGKAQAFTADVSKKLALQTMLSDVLNEWERIDILVNHASVQPHDTILDMDEYHWRRTIDATLTAAFLTTQSIGRVMRELGGGVILNIGPADQDDYDQPRAAYLSGKAGVIALTQAAAQELNQFNIRVNALSPKADRQEESVAAALQLCQGSANGEVVIIGEE